ncbi:trans-sialidase, partial [Trypanosoma conorhini]
AGRRSQLDGPKPVVEANKIFLLLERLHVTSEKRATFGLQLVVGEVGEANSGGKRITWDAESPLEEMVNSQLTMRSWSQFQGSNGRGVLMRDATIVFPLVAVKADGKKVCTVIYSKDNGGTWQFPAKGSAVEDCSDPNLLEWEGQLLMVATHATHHKRVYASSDVGETWMELSGTHSNVLSEAMKAAPTGSRVDIVTATIGGRQVILFTVLGLFADGRRGKDALHLYMTDMTRFYPLGPISDADGAVKTSSSLLYANDELFALYDRKAGAASVVALTHLSAQLEEIKRVLRTWDAVDEKVARLCGSAGKGGVAAGSACSPPVPTAGLVGFLSGGGDSEIWENEYLGANASVSGAAARVDGGVRFKGGTAAGEWRVGNRWKNHRFHFVKDNFTLVATVTIETEPSGGGSPVPVLGVRGGGGEARLMELSYTADRKWAATFSGATAQVGGGAWERNRAHQVALVLQDGSGSAWVDAQALGSPVRLHAAGAAGLEVSQFDFMGGDRAGTGNGQVTLTNVLLYNRPLSAAELQLFVPRGGQTGAGSRAGAEDGAPGTADSAAHPPAEAPAPGRGEEAPTPSPPARRGPAREAAPVTPMAQPPLRR